MASERSPHTFALVVFGVVMVAASGCSIVGSDDVSSRSASEPGLGMRPVPTVPSVLDPIDPDDAAIPTDTGAIGDPQRDPDDPEPLPPLPESPVIDACAWLAELGASDTIGAVVGAPVAVELIGDEACRFVAGPVVAEVHFVSEASVETDWFRRSRIEPVGAVTADAVGLQEFLAPGSSSSAGYTVALVSRRQGALVAVRGTADDRGLVEQIAGLVAGSL